MKTHILGLGLLLSLISSIALAQGGGLPIYSEERNRLDSGLKIEKNSESKAVCKAPQDLMRAALASLTVNGKTLIIRDLRGDERIEILEISVNQHPLLTLPPGEDQQGAVWRTREVPLPDEDLVSLQVRLKVPVRRKSREVVLDCRLDKPGKNFAFVPAETGGTPLCSCPFDLPQ